MLTVFVYALWLVAPALQSAIGYRMWIRRLYRDYPPFFTHTISHMLSVLVLFDLPIGWAFATYNVRPTSLRARYPQP